MVFLELAQAHSIYLFVEYLSFCTFAEKITTFQISLKFSRSEAFIGLTFIADLWLRVLLEIVLLLFGVGGKLYKFYVEILLGMYRQLYLEKELGASFRLNGTRYLQSLITFC